MDKKLSGKIVSDVLYKELNEYLSAKNDTRLRLVDISIGEDFGAKMYAEMKKRTLENKLNYDVNSLHLNQASLNELLCEINKINEDSTYDGLMLQLPLPKTLRTYERTILDTISKAKDVDCLTSCNLGDLMVGNNNLLPCTPLGIITLLKVYGVPLNGKNIVIINRSNIIGKPLEQLFLQEDATITLAHSKTKNLKELVKRADIVVAALNKQEFITEEFIKEEAIIIDVGVHKNSEGKTVGDVDFDSVYEKCSYITPPTGGVGPMTICMLGYNVAKARYGKEIDKVLNQGIEKAKVLIKN